MSLKAGAISPVGSIDCGFFDSKPLLSARSKIGDEDECEVEDDNEFALSTKLEFLARFLRNAEQRPQRTRDNPLHPAVCLAARLQGIGQRWLQGSGTKLHSG